MPLSFPLPGHLSHQTVLHLAKLSPDSFPLAFVTQLFEVGASGQARKGAARVICLLREEEEDREGVAGGDKDNIS